MNPARPLLKIGFLSPHNPLDRRAFSGTVYSAARVLNAMPEIDLRLLGEYRAPSWVDRFRRSYEIKDIDTLDLNGLDAVLGLVATPLLDQLAEHHPQLPFLHVTDATPKFLTDVYGWSVPDDALAAERRVVQQAAATVYSSDIMARRAASDLEIPGLAPHARSFGVNINHLPVICPEKPSLERLNLLFVGLDWARKGGDVAIATLNALRARGVDAHLTVIGCCPERHRAHPEVTYLGYLNKNRARDLRKIVVAYTHAHLLLLPSRADCTPMVVGEALAYGTPVLSSDTGGIRSLIGADAGALLPKFASPEAWTNEILALTRDQDVYAFASEASFDRARTRLSWTGWARDITRLMIEVATEETPLGTAVPFDQSNAA